MKLTKLTNTILAMGLTLSLGACSSNNSNSASTADSNNSSEKVTVKIATSPDYPPYENLEGGELVGFDIEMVDWLFNWMQENGYNYDYEWSQMQFDTIVGALQTGQADLGVAGFVYNEDRAENASFSEPYHESAQVVLLNSDSDIESVADLKGKKIGAQSGTTGEVCAKENTDESNVSSIPDASVLIETLKAGNIDAAILEKPVAEKYVQNGDYKILDEVLQEEQNYIITSKEGNEELLEVVNEALTAFKASDDYQTLIEKWFN